MTVKLTRRALVSGVIAATALPRAAFGPSWHRTILIPAGRRSIRC